MVLFLNTQVSIFFCVGFAPLLWRALFYVAYVCNATFHPSSYLGFACLSAILSRVPNGDRYDEMKDNLAGQPVLLNQASEEPERCCGNHGICSHEVLKDGEPNFDCDSNMVRMMKKVASFVT